MLFVVFLKAYFGALNTSSSQLLPVTSQCCVKAYLSQFSTGWEHVFYAKLHYSVSNVEQFGMYSFDLKD